MSQPIAFLTRKEHFSACHRLHSPLLSDAENLEIFGKCNNLNGHGHNYIVEVTVRGPIEQRTGMVMNVTELRDAMDEVIFKRLDHKSLDKDVEYFKNIPSTTENLTVYIWDNIRMAMKRPELLYEVKIYETDKNSVIYRGPIIPNGIVQQYESESQQKSYSTKKSVEREISNPPEKSNHVKINNLPQRKNPVKKSNPVTISDPPEINNAAKMCMMCENRFYSSTSLRRHQDVCKGRVRKKVCGFCKKRYSRNYYLKIHIAEQHGDNGTKAQRSEANNKCRLCEKRFTSISRLKQHLKIKHKEEMELESVFIKTEDTEEYTTEDINMEYFKTEEMDDYIVTEEMDEYIEMEELDDYIEENRNITPT